MEIRLKIKYQNSIVEIIIGSESSLRELRERIARKLNIDMYNFNIVYNDRVLMDEKRTVEDLEIMNEGMVSVKSKGMDIEPGSNVDLMENSAVKTMFNNPDAIKKMIKLIPGMEDQMKSNPELKSIFNDPSTFEDMAKIMGNPDYRQEMLKNVDLAMSKMENIPGGLNLMSGMMKAVEPMQNMDLRPKISFKEGESNPGKIEVPLPNVGRNENLVVKYRKQLQELRINGFKNLQKNIRILNQYQGDLDSAMVALAEENE